MAVPLLDTIDYLRMRCLAPVPVIARTLGIMSPRRRDYSQPLSAEPDKMALIPANEIFKASDARAVGFQSSLAPDTTSRQDDDEISVLLALKTAFSIDADPDAFLERVRKEIVEVESAIIETCSRNRIRTEDNLYTLLEARDGIAEQTSELEKATRAASQVTNIVNAAASRLKEKVYVRKNLDAALAIAAQTRKLTRMYAKIEDTIDSRRLYTAFRLLQVLEEEVRCIQPGTILQELVPDTHRLRAQVTMHARKAFRGWLSAVRKFEQSVGAYALHHEVARNQTQQSLVEASQANPSDTYSIPVSPLSQSIETKPKPWTPLLTPNAIPPQPFTYRRPVRSPSQRTGFGTPPKQSFGAEPGNASNLSPDARRLPRSPSTQVKENIPTLYLRPLLQGIMVHDGLGLLGDLKATYHQERNAHLQRMLEECDQLKDGVSPMHREGSPTILGNSKSRQIETITSKICGFFVVERAVELHGSCEVLPRSVVDKDWWPPASGRLQVLFEEMNNSALEQAVEKSRIQSLAESVALFREVNGLCK